MLGTPENAIYIVVGEMNIVGASLKKSNRWSTQQQQEEEQDSLIRNFAGLKDVLLHVSELSAVEPLSLLTPFLNVVRSEHTSGPATGLALSALHKFLAYGLIDINNGGGPAMENIADAVTHARFVGTDPGSDEVVLMKILQVLRILMLTPAGTVLSNEAVCEIMQSCFRICFEMRLSELLRKSAEHALTDMVQLLFSRLLQFSDDSKWASNKKLKMRAVGMDSSKPPKRKKSPRTRHKKHSTSSSAKVSPAATPTEENNPSIPNSEEVLSTCSTEMPLPSETNSELLSSDPAVTVTANNDLAQEPSPDQEPGQSLDSPKVEHKDFVEIQVDDHPSDTPREFVNSQGVHFTSSGPDESSGGVGPTVPHGLPCVRELFRFLVTLANPMDRHNSDVMVQIGLNLLTVAIEIGADHIGSFASLLALVKDEACRNLFSILKTEKLSLFTATLRVCLLLFESLRTHLKFQLEMFLHELMEGVVNNERVPYEHKEAALDCIVQLWKVPGLVTELYLNYDCDLYASNLFEDMAKFLSKNAFPVSGLYSTHLLSLDALLAVIDSIEAHCHYRILSESHLLTSDHPSGATTVENSNILKEGSALVQLGPSGFLLGQYLSAGDSPPAVKSEKMTSTPLIKPNRMKISAKMPTHEEIMAIKHKKKLLSAGTEQFNIQPSRGIAFLQEHGFLSPDLNPQEVAYFLRDNPQIDKRMIGEYISNRKNLRVLEAFVRSFNFEDTRIDEALRQYLETFRLPGEAPLISLLLEHFAEHWHKSNGHPFATNDAAFTLAYAIIMLNVDQHNHNVKKQNIPMTCEDFKKNLKKVNGGEDFDEDMLEEIYNSIRNEEIVMPAEQVGLVRENYLWKVLLRRGACKEGIFRHASNGLFDHDIFSLIWGPTVAALSFVFDKSTDPAIVQKANSGFRKCAMISAHYGMSDVFDHLVISLCKFTTLLSTTDSPESLPIAFGNNPKAQLATKTMFNLAHRHGDILREGWKNIFDCLLQLYRAHLLPKPMVEAEDFVNPNGVVSLVRENVSATIPRMDSSGILSSFYSYITAQAESSGNQRGVEEEAARQEAISCIEDCHPDQLISESKFLRMDSLQELLKTLIFICHNPENQLDENSTVFLLELLIKIVLQNKDRVSAIWPNIRELLYSIVMEASLREQHFLLERSVVGLLRIAVRLVRREDMIPQVIQSLRMLLLLKGHMLLQVSRQVTAALHELVRTSASTIHSSDDWMVIFTLLECAGAGAKPPRVLSSQPPAVQSPVSDTSAQSDSEINKPDSGISSDRSYASDSELYDASARTNLPTPPSPHRTSFDNTGNGWIMVNKDGEIETVKMKPFPLNQFNIVYQRELLPHEPSAFVKACETLSFLVRDAAHITVDNFESCVFCIRTFVEASVNCGLGNQEKRERKKTSSRKREETKARRAKTSPNRSTTDDYDADDEEKERDLSPVYQQICFQLLDLMHTLHTRAASIFQSYWTMEELLQPAGPPSPRVDLWNSCWCPLLQGIARLCCDMRRPVRTSALTFLQRALLVHDLQVLTPAEWENCFNKVLFPLLSKLLEPIHPGDPSGMEETRMRGAALLSKVFLQHLNPLLSLPTFTALWLTILDFMCKYMHADGSDLLGEAIPESLKNMLLVMGTAGIFQAPDSALWQVTWDKIDSFLPHLREEIFKPPANNELLSTQNNVVTTQNTSSDVASLTGGSQGLSPPISVPTSSGPSPPLSPSPPTMPTTSSSPIILHPPTTTYLSSPLPILLPVTDPSSIP